MIPSEKISKIIDTYKTLEKELASANISKKDFVKKSKEYSNIGEIINEAKGYLSLEKEKIELEKIIKEKASEDKAEGAIVSDSVTSSAEQKSDEQQS